MASAHAEVVPTTVIDEADIGDWPAADGHYDPAGRRHCGGVRAEPSLNVWYNAQAGERRLIGRIDIGIAIDTDGGLIVPVLRNVGERDAKDLRAGLDRMRADAKARAIPPDELRGATITLSNFGTIGGRFASLVVVAAPGGDRGCRSRRPARERAQGRGGRCVASSPLSLTFDHRVVTGGEAARFLMALKSDLDRA